MKYASFIANWVLGVLFFIISLLAIINSSFLSGLLLLIASLTLMPISRRFVLPKINEKMSPMIRAAFVSILFIGFVVSVQPNEAQLLAQKEIKLAEEAALLEQQKIAKAAGFLSVEEYEKAKSVEIPTKALYDTYLEQQAEIKVAEEKRKAEEAKKAEKARLVAIAEEKLKADEAENARLAEEKRKAEEAENARLAAIAEENRKAENARLAAKAKEKLKAEKAEKANLAKIETVLVCQSPKHLSDYSVIALYSKTANVISFSSGGLFEQGTRFSAPMSKSISSIEISHPHYDKGYRISRQNLTLVSRRTVTGVTSTPFVLSDYYDCRLASVTDYQKARNTEKKKREADKKKWDKLKQDAIKNQKL